MKKLLCALLCLGMAASLVACASPASPPAQSNSSSPTPAPASSTSSAPVQPSSSSASAAPSAEASSEASSSEPTYSYSTIGGSHITNISMGLEENLNIPRAAIRSSKNLSVAKHYGSSHYTEPNTGLDFSYDYGSGENFEIIQVDFDIMNSFQISEDDFYNVATAYLSFCATMPYDSSDINAAKKFIEDNIKSAPVEGVSTQIGDAVFTLYAIHTDDGICTIINLSIVAEEISS